MRRARRPLCRSRWPPPWCSLTACGDDDDGGGAAPRRPPRHDDGRRRRRRRPRQVTPPATDRRRRPTTRRPRTRPMRRPRRAPRARRFDPAARPSPPGEPAFPPYVIDDEPESGQGFEAAVAYAVAGAMGFGPDAVTWVRTTFEAPSQPGPKDFDFNLQQYGITPEREEAVTFSHPYYAGNQAILGYRRLARRDGHLGRRLPASSRSASPPARRASTFVTGRAAADGRPVRLQRQRGRQAGDRHQADRRHRRRPADGASTSPPSSSRAAGLRAVPASTAPRASRGACCSPRTTRSSNASTRRWRRCRKYRIARRHHRRVDDEGGDIRDIALE